MVTLRSAYEMLGLKEGAGKDEIIKRYDILLKKYRMNKLQGLNVQDDEQKLQEISEAYNLLMGYDTKDLVSDTEKKESLLLKKLGVDEKKTRNFLHYYKFHILSGIAALLILVSIIRGCATRVEPDLNIAFIGDFYYDTEVLKDRIKGSLPGTKEISIDGAVISESNISEQGYAMQMKAMVLLAAGDVDVYILDKISLERFGKQGAFISLDELADELKLDKESNKDFILKPENEQGEQHLYGLNVGGSSILSEPDVMGKEKIAAISVKAKHYENAVKFLKLLLGKQ